jgi:hypothetical protein
MRRKERVTFRYQGKLMSGRIIAVTSCCTTIQDDDGRTYKLKRRDLVVTMDDGNGDDCD